jgi:hypothetical protein
MRRPSRFQMPTQRCGVDQTRAVSYEPCRQTRIALLSVGRHEGVNDAGKGQHCCAHLVGFDAVPANLEERVRAPNKDQFTAGAPDRPNGRPAAGPCP